MKKTEIYFDSRDGESKIHALRYEPDALPDGKPVAILQIVHGMAEYVERYEETAKFFTDRGFVVTGDDHLGHGKTVQKGGIYGYFCKNDPATVVVRDVHRLKKMTQAQYPGVPYFILGHSMGSYILRNYVCRYGTGIQGAIFLGTGSQSAAVLAFGKVTAGVLGLLQGGKHKSNLLNVLVFASYNKRIEKPRTALDWVSREEGNVDRYAQDEQCGFTFTVNGFQTLFELVSRAQNRKNLEKIPRDLPMFFASGTDDPVGNYGEGVRTACRNMEKVGVEQLELKFYEKDRHEILNESDREVVMQDILDWVMRHLPEEVS